MRKTSEKNPQKKILKKLTKKDLRPSIFLQQDFLANRIPSQIQLEIKDLTVKMRSFFSMYYSLSGIKDLRSYCLKTLQDCFPIQKGKALRRGSFIWRKWGTMQNGRILTGHPSGCRVVITTSFLLDGIIKKSAPQKYYLNGKTLQYLLGRLLRRNDRSFVVLLRKRDQALTIAQLSLTSLDLEHLFQRKRKDCWDFQKAGPKQHQQHREKGC